MKTEDVEELLRGVIRDNLSKTCWTISAEHLTELANRAVEAEREACAKIADGYQWADRAAEAIRARGQK
jgi:hypothetical protein